MLQEGSLWEEVRVAPCQGRLTPQWTQHRIQLSPSAKLAVLCEHVFTEGQKTPESKRERERGGNKKSEMQQREPQGPRREEEVLHGAGAETSAAACGGPFVRVNGYLLKEQRSVDNPCWSQGKG